MSGIVGAGLSVLGPASVLGPVPASAQTAAGLSGPPSEWGAQVSVGGTWYDNPRFVPGGRRSSSWSTRGRASLSHTRRFRTGSFSLSGYGGRLYYPEIEGFSQWTYGGSTSLGWTASRSTSLSLSQDYSRSNTRQLTSLDEEEGLPVPTTGVHSFRSNLGLTHRLGRRTQLEMGGAFRWRRYDNPTLVGGEQLHSSIGLARLIGQNGAVSLGYGFSQSWFDQRGGRVHVATLGVRERPARGWSVELSGGAAYLETFEQFHPTGQASLGVSGRRVSASARYHRDFGLAFGYGRETIADRASVSLGWTPVERLSFQARYSYGYRRDPADEDFRVHSHVLSGGLSWSIPGGVGFSASYAWERSRTESFGEASGQRATASLSYGFGWR